MCDMGRRLYSKKEYLVGFLCGGLLTLVISQQQTKSALFEQVHQMMLGAAAATQAEDHRVCTQPERKAWLQNNCQVLNSTTTRGTPRVLVMHRQKVVYCSVPKAACSSMKFFFVNFTRGGKFVHTGEVGGWIHNASYLSRAGITYERYNKTRMGKYLKILVVREPFSRLVSAHKNKMTTIADANNDRSFISMKKAVIQKYRNSSRMSNVTKNSPNATMDEFIAFLLDQEPKKINDHFRAYSPICSPCSMNYDLILKTETLYDDVALMRKVLKTSLPFSSLNISPVDKRMGKRVFQKNLAKAFLTTTSSSLDKVHKLYKEEFRLFGYHFNTSSRVSSCVIKTDNGEYCC